MISWSDSKGHSIENLDEAALDTSYKQTLLKMSDAIRVDVKDREPGACTPCIEDKGHINDSIFDVMLQLKEPRSSFHDQDYVEMIKEFQWSVKMVRRMTRPGCSPEMLNMFLSSMSSLVETLSVMSSKQHIQASL